MVCEHLHAVEEAILRAGAVELERGQLWSDNCREWVYFDCYLDLVAIRRVFDLAPEVVDRSYRGTHDGAEHGIVCTRCHDALMGVPDRKGLVFDGLELRS